MQNNIKRVLVMTDSPKLHTGFGRVGKEIWSYLHSTGKYDITCLGWFHQETKESVPYYIFQTKTDQQGRIAQEDKYGHESFSKFVDKFKPDLVWTLGDWWMTDHVATSPKRNTFKWISYFPIDGLPSPSKWGKVVENADVAVAYGQWGARVIRQRAPRANLKYVYHGVYSRVFTPSEEEKKQNNKKALLGIDDDKRVIGIIARNQPRKAFDKLFEAYAYILYGEYVKCSDCSKITVNSYDLVDHKYTKSLKCKHCHGVNIISGIPRDDIRLYVHAAPVDCGWDLIDLQNDYNLSGKVLVNPQLKIGIGVSDSTLAAIYNCFDVFTLPTRGEGFGLPILEAMSCGVPVVVTDYSAHTEWIGGGGILVPPAAIESEPITNIRRAVIDIDLYVTALINVLDDKDLRKKMGSAGRKIAESMDWKIINKQWENIIDSVLYPDGVPEKVNALDREYVLEVL